MSEIKFFEKNTNQAFGVAEFCIEALWSQDVSKRLNPSAEVIERTKMFFLDATVCGLSAIALLDNEGLGGMRKFHLLSSLVQPTRGLMQGRIKRWGASVLGSDQLLNPSVAAFLDGFAHRAWDANGTNFAYYPDLGNIEGEFGHNDFYGAVIAAAQMIEADGMFAIRAMILLDEIRNRLGSVWSLKDRHLDHVLHGGIATAFVVGAMLGLTAVQIEQAVGMYVAHYVPTRANRAGEAEIADSKGAAAGLAAEKAFESVYRVLFGFAGPRDIFRISESIFRLMGGPGIASKVFARADGRVAANLTPKAEKTSPFDLHLTRSGSGFAIMQMHIKLALYEHQSAGMLAGLLLALRKVPQLLQDPLLLSEINVGIYNPAADIICQPARWNPTTREAADHSAAFIGARFLQKALLEKTTDWGKIMLGPLDFSHQRIKDLDTRALMAKLKVHHRPEFDDKYPEGIPTSVELVLTDGTKVDSGLVMFPPGHTNYDEKDFGSFSSLFGAKLNMLGELAFGDPLQAGRVLSGYANLAQMTAEQVRQIHSGYQIPNRSSLMD